MNSIILRAVKFFDVTYVLASSKASGAAGGFVSD